MASTRNYNTKSDYCLQQKRIQHQEKWIMDPQRWAHCKPALPCPGVMPQYYPASILSRNSVDIESRLYGINSTNLVKPELPLTPQLTNLPPVQFFGYVPLMIPKAPEYDTRQRPFPVGERG